MSIWTKTMIEDKEKKAEEIKEIWNFHWHMDDSVDENWANFFTIIKTLNKEKISLRSLSQTPDGLWKVFITHMDTTLGSGNGVNVDIITALNEAIRIAKLVIKNNEKFRERVKSKKDALKDFMGST